MTFLFLCIPLLLCCLQATSCHNAVIHTMEDADIVADGNVYGGCLSIIVLLCSYPPLPPTRTATRSLFSKQMSSHPSVSGRWTCLWKLATYWLDSRGIWQHHVCMWEKQYGNHARIVKCVPRSGKGKYNTVTLPKAWLWLLNYCFLAGCCFT